MYRVSRHICAVKLPLSVFRRGVKFRPLFQNRQKRMYTQNLQKNVKKTSFFQNVAKNCQIRIALAAIPLKSLPTVRVYKTYRISKRITYGNRVEQPKWKLYPFYLPYSSPGGQGAARFQHGFCGSMFPRFMYGFPRNFPRNSSVQGVLCNTNYAAPTRGCIPVRRCPGHGGAYVFQDQLCVVETPLNGWADAIQ